MHVRGGSSSRQQGPILLVYPTRPTATCCVRCALVCGVHRAAAGQAWQGASHLGLCSMDRQLQACGQRDSSGQEPALQHHTFHPSCWACSVLVSQTSLLWSLLDLQACHCLTSLCCVHAWVLGADQPLTVHHHHHRRRRHFHHHPAKARSTCSTCRQQQPTADMLMQHVVAAVVQGGAHRWPVQSDGHSWEAGCKQRLHQGKAQGPLPWKAMKQRGALLCVHPMQ